MISHRYGSGARRQRSVAIVLLLAVSLPAWWSDTNSRASNRRGVAAWERQQYSAAVESFRRAALADHSPRANYNLGTAEIAAGNQEKGAAHLGEAAKDPELRADAYFNRGSGALAARELDPAIHDLIEALKANPRHAAAKRNLEIALAQRDAVQRQQENGEDDRAGDSDEPQQPSTNEGQQQPEGDVDLEALLRSVQQQEEEELRRMKGRAGERPAGW